MEEIVLTISALALLSGDLSKLRSWAARPAAREFERAMSMDRRGGMLATVRSSAKGHDQGGKGTYVVRKAQAQGQMFP